MKGTRMPQDSWCEPFSLCLGRAAKSWYRQLPKKTQRRWNLLSEAFLDYYCSQFDQSARTRYYSARRKENEPICDFLIRLNGYARTAKIQYGKGGADASDHVEHFRLNCGDDDIMDLLYPMRLDDIERVEKIINTKILGEKRKRQRDRLSDDRRDDRRDYRRDDRRTRRDDGRDRRVTVAVTSDDEEGDAVKCQPSRRLGQLDYDDDDSDYDREGYLDSEEESDHDYIDAGLADEKSRSGNAREDSSRTQRNSARQQPNSAGHWNPVNPPPDRRSRVSRSSDRQDNYGRRGDSRERPQYGPCAACGGQGHSVHFCRKRCKFCQQVHDVGRCELFQRYERLANFVTQNVDKSKLPTDRQDLYTPKAKYIFAYVGEAGRPEDERKSDGDGSDMDGIDGELGYSKGESPAMMSNADTTRLETGATERTKTMRLLHGERLGWWSAQKFDRRVRMGALVMGAVNDQRTKILLDTGANISAINEVFARKLRLKRHVSRDVQIGVQGIGKDKVGTSTRAWVKVTLGWEVSYEFEVWIMDHHAGVDLILGTDFMIPAGIRLDLYNSLTKIPDEVAVPLIKSQNSADDPRGGLQITDGPTDTICLPGRLTAEFRVRRRQPAESTHELWVRRTKDWIPTVVLNRSGRVTRVVLTSMKSSLTWCPAHFRLLNWTPLGILPPEGYVRLSSANRVPEAVVNSAESVDTKPKATRVKLRGNPPDRGRCEEEIDVNDELLDADPEENMSLRYLLTASIDDNSDSELGDCADTYKCAPNSLCLGDSASELACIPDLADEIATQLEYSANNDMCAAHTAKQTTRLVKMQRPVDRTMISITPALGLDETLKRATLPSKNSATMGMDPELLYAEVPPCYNAYVLSFHGSAKTTKNGGYGSCSWILWKLPFWDIEIAATARLPSTTTKIAEYAGMNNGVVAALQRGVSDLIIVGDARLVMQQPMGVIACKKDVLSVELARHKELTKNLNSVCYLHVVRLYNSANASVAMESLRALNKIPEMLYTSRDSADIIGNSANITWNSADPIKNSADTIGNSAATSGNSADTSWNSADAAEEPKVTMATLAKLPAELGEARTPDANAIDQLVVQAKRRQSISIAQDEELGWADIKACPKKEFTQLTHGRAHNTRKVAHELVLSQFGLLYQQDKSGRPEKLGEASRVEDVKHAGAVPFRVTTTELSRVDLAREQVEDDPADNGSRVEDARLDGAVPSQVTTTELSRVDSARQQVEENSAMVEAKENSAELRGWSCGASVATCGTSECWSHRKDLSHNWSGGASVAPYGTSDAWWRLPVSWQPSHSKQGGVISSAMARIEQVGVSRTAHDEGPMLRSQMRGCLAVADVFDPRTDSAVTKSTAELKLDWNNADGPAGYQLHLNDGPRIQVIQVMDKAENKLRPGYGPGCSGLT
ncbi:unnamed protein product [Phytophthora fragariaefolia]|uniref:Unnamed protein product n=1 Tax=Phytophthora fragariaefolia TaxID=1490495 RepID=A0A9W7D581_9STRA|nr:unnamed protein product [Phytophthora fragariaefolia]